VSSLNILAHPIIFQQPKRLTDGSAWQAHLTFAFFAIDLLRPDTFVELGTHKGDSYCAFCQAVDELKLPTRCSAVDTWVGEEHAGVYGDDVFTQLQATHDPLYGHFSRLIRSTFDAALADIADGSVDLLHIDGLHTYEAVRHDFESWLPKMSRRGVVLFHDTCVRERDFGVWRLWGELSQKYPAQQFRFGHGLGIVAVGPDQPAEFASLIALDPSAWATVEEFFWRLGRPFDQLHEQSWTQTASDGTTSIRKSLIDSLHQKIALQHASIGLRTEELVKTSGTLQELQQQHASLTDNFTQTSGTLQELQQQHAVQNEHLTQTSAALQALQQQHAMQNEHLTQTSAALQALQQQHAVQTENLRQTSSTLHAIYTSTSWRLTRPMRGLTRITKGGLRFSSAAVSQQTRRIKFLAGVAPKAVHRVGGLRKAVVTAVRVARSEGWQGVKRRLVSTSIAPPPPSEYAEWILQNDTLNEADRLAIQRHIKRLPHTPLISVVMPVYNTPERYLREAIISVIAQSYPHWELCMANDASPQPHIAEMLNKFAAMDTRIKVVHRERNGNISAATNSALQLASGEFVALLDHDDLLAETALYEIAVEINAHPDVDVIYSDEDKVDKNGVRSQPHFKTDFNPELLLSQNMVSHLGVYRMTLIKKIGGLRETFEGSQDYDLVLRAWSQSRSDRIRHIPAILYHWRSDSQRPSFSESQLSRCVSAARKSIQEFLDIEGEGARAVPAPTVTNYSRVIRSVPDPKPLVTIIIPTKNRADLLSVSADGVLNKTNYTNIELFIVDHESTESATVALLAKLRSDRRVRILPFSGQFNYSAMNNMAAAAANGSLLVLLNNDIEITTADWLTEMVSHAVRPEIGAVGAKLFYPSGPIQHAGVVLGLGGVAGHGFVGKAKTDCGYFGYTMVSRAVMAVTGACLVVRKDLFFQVGGLNETDLAIAFNDIDLCLKFHFAGFRNVWTPFAELIHHESVSRGADDNPEKQARFARECAYMIKTWGACMNSDPFYNPNFSLEGPKYYQAAAKSRRHKPWAES
jgi:O-antigen biosynthesis protein